MTNNLSLDKKTLADYLPELARKNENCFDKKLTENDGAAYEVDIPNFTDTPGYWEKTHRRKRTKI